jgi:site-specific DNA recombinase
MAELEGVRATIEVQLAEITAGDKVISLHPAALDRYRRDIRRLAALLPRNETGETDGLVEVLRSLVSAAIVHAPPNSTELEIEIRGYLEQLLGAPTFMRRTGGG